eukprot:4263923-Ditylum_brightwellii.AAC.1
MHSISARKEYYNITKSDQFKLQPRWPSYILALHSNSSSHFCSASCKATTHSRCSYHQLQSAALQTIYARSMEL